MAQITTVDMSLRYILLDHMESQLLAGYDVVAISSPGIEVKAVEECGIRYIPVQMSRNLSPFADLVSLWRLFRVMRRERFDIVHTHTPKPGLLGQLAARLAGVPIVINTIHGFYFHENMSPLWRKVYISFERMAGMCSTLIFSVNQEDVETAVRERISSRKKIKLLGPGGMGVNLDRFNPEIISASQLAQKRTELGIKPDERVVGFVGRLVAEKGVLELLQAARQLSDHLDKVRFLFIGPDDSIKKDAISPDVASDYGVEDICIFAGHRHDMPELYALMDVFVLPSHREGLPLSPMEACAMAIPCIVTDIRGCREVVSDGENGILVPLGDVDALAAAIERLLSDPILARNMSVAARKVAVERFDKTTVYQTVEATYAHLLQAKGLPLPAAVLWMQTVASTGLN